MTRRQAVKRATMLAFGMALGKLDALKAEQIPNRPRQDTEGTNGRGQLTCDLNQWATIVFKHKGKTITVPVSEVFASLAS